LLTALAAKAEPDAAVRAMATTSDFHILQYRCFHTASVAFRKAQSPLHVSLYEMQAEPQLNAAFMPQLVWEMLWP
jgi:hypothetical protein